MAFKQIGNRLHKLLFKIAGSENKPLIILALQWKEIVGKILAERSFVYKMENKTVFIGVTNNVWMQELTLNKQMILKRIKERCKLDLKDIIFISRTKL